MLKRIKVGDLKEGMMFSEPLLFDDGKNRVLGKMSPVSQRELKVLADWNVPFVLTAGKIVKKTPEESRGKTENKAEAADAGNAAAGAVSADTKE